MTVRSALSCIVLTVALALASTSSAEPFAVGSGLPTLELPDAQGAASTLPANTRALVFSRDMSAGRIVKEAVAKAGNDLFERSHAVYVVDLAGMPGFVRSMFALPGLRRRPYKILVDEEGTVTKEFPSSEGKPTVLLVKDGKIESIQYPADADTLLALLEPPNIAR